MRSVVRIDKPDQILGAELMVDVGDLDLPDLSRLRVVQDAAHHVEQRADRHVLPFRILRQPASDRVIELELAGSFESLRMSAEVNPLVLLPMSNNVSGPIGFLSLSPLSPA